MALIVASTILPPDSFTSRWSPTLCLGMVAEFYSYDEARNSLSPFTPDRERASGKALTLIRLVPNPACC